MGTDFHTEVWEALADHLASFVYGQQVDVIFGLGAGELTLLSVNRMSIEAKYASMTKVNDVSTRLTHRTDIQFAMTIRVPERHGVSELNKLADALAEHFMQGDVVVAYSLDDALDKQEVSIVSRPTFTAGVGTAGGFHVGTLTVNGYFQPRR